MKILIVDDHPTNRKLLRAILESEGHEVIDAHDGSQATEILDRETVDMVIADLLLPNVDGYSLCTYVRKRQDLSDLIFIVYSASYTSDADENLALDLGADAFIRKPATPSKIIQTISDCLGRPRRTPKIDFTETTIDQDYASRLVSKIEEKHQELYQKTQQLQAVDAHLIHLLEHSPVVLYSYRLGSQENPTIEASRNIETLFHQPSIGLTIADWHKRIAADDRPAAMAAYREIAETGGFSIVYKFAMPDGGERWIQDSCKCAKGESGEVDQVVGSWLDVSDRVYAARALADSQYQFRGLLEASEFIAVILDLDGRVTFCNDYFLRLTGWTIDEVLGASWLEKVPPIEGIGDFDWLLNRIRTQKKPTIFESTISKRKGEQCDVVWSWTGIRSVSGELLSVAIVGEDVTDRNEATRRLQEMNRELERRVQERTSDLEMLNSQLKAAKELAEMANQAKTAFLSRMSHEFRTPMNSILGFGQLLAMANLDEDSMDSVHYILKSGKHLLSLINDILEISKVEQGSFGISLETVEVDPVIDEAITMVRQMAVDKQVDIQVTRTNRRVQADIQRLRQILLNLLSNAIKYNRAGGKVEVSGRVEPGDQVAIQVRDNGLGIAEDLQGKLFLPFERLGAEQSAIDGTGLGLALSKSLAEAMGGTIVFASSAGKGSTFAVLLPGTPEPESPLGTTDAPSRESTPTVATGTLLVIDDNTVSVELLRRIFGRQSEIRVVTAGEGGLGISMAATDLPKCILLDYHLPDMSGRDALVELKENPNLSKIPVIVMSADAYSSREASLLELGAFRYIAKPFDLEVLSQAVIEAMQEGTHYD